MQHYRVFPDAPIGFSGVVSDQFLALQIDSFIRACQYALSPMKG
jgi:hypothetical protein